MIEEGIAAGFLFLLENKRVKIGQNPYFVSIRQPIEKPYGLFHVVVVIVVKNTHALSARFILKLSVSSRSKIGSDSEYLALNLGLYSSDKEYGKRRRLLSTFLARMSSTRV